MPKTITLDATPFLFNFGGVGRTTQTLFEAMVACNSEYEFKLYARCFKGKKLMTPNGASLLRRFRLPKKAEPVIEGLGLIEKMVSADLYHATDHYMPLKYPQNAVVTVHDMLFLVRPENNWDIHEHQRKVVPPFVKQCRYIITCSEYTKRDIVKELQIDPEKIAVVPWGIDRITFRPSRSFDDLQNKLIQEMNLSFPYFLSVGCNMDRKNTPRLLEAYVKLLKDNPENHLVLVWNPPDEVRMKYSVGSLASRIHFTGRVTDEQLVLLYQGATATVYPSDYEGFGLPVLESMSCGTPIITSDRSSLPEVGGDVAVYVNPDDTGSICNAMAGFENKIYDCDELRIRGYAQCDLFSWERCAQKTLDVYQRALED